MILRIRGQLALRVVIFSIGCIAFGVFWNQFWKMKSQSDTMDNAGAAHFIGHANRNIKADKSWLVITADPHPEVCIS
jgi:hypothetical protein